MRMLPGSMVRAWMAGILLLASAIPLFAEDKKPEAGTPNKAADEMIYTTLRDVINKGADLYNEPNYDWNGCYRLYEGTLMTLRPFLAHRPTLQKTIDEGLTKASRNPVMARRAFDLREVIDKIRAEVNPKPAPPPVAKTLWDRLGGEAGVQKIIDDFVATGTTDPKVDFFRGGKYKLDAKGVADLKKKLVDMISMYTGGPLKYTGKTMKEAHKGMGITDAQFDALAGHLKAAMEKNGVKPDDVKAVMVVIAGTRNDIVEPKEPPKTTKLWDRLGGEANMKKVVDDFVAAAAGDPKVDFFRGGKYKLDAKGVADLKKKLVEMMSAVTEGPLKYSGKSMKDAHKGMGITDAQFDACAAHLKTALEKNNAKPEDVKAVMAIVETTRKDIVEKK